MSPRRYVGDDLDHADAGTENGRHIEFAGSTVWREVDFNFVTPWASVVESPLTRNSPEGIILIAL